MNWDDLLAFRAVAMELSFTKAARKLNLSTSVVSQRVSRLERKLGETLLNRTTRKSVLTASGHLVLMLVNQMYDQWNRIASVADEPPGPEVGRLLRLGLPDWMPESVMRILGAILPRGRSVISVADSVINLARLGSRKIDFVLAAEFDFSPLRVPANAHVRTIHRDSLRIGVPPAHPLAAAERISCDELRGEQVVLDAVAPGLAHPLADLLRARGRCQVVLPDLDPRLPLPEVNRPRPDVHPPDDGALEGGAAHRDLVWIPLVDDALGHHVFVAWDPATVEDSLASNLHWLASEHRGRCAGLLEERVLPVMRLAAGEIPRAG